MPFGHGDGGGGPTREMLERARRLASADPRVTVAVGTLDEFFDAVEAEIRAGAPVPVWRGELYLESHRGTLTSQLRTKLGNRRCERLLVEAELWAATLDRPADVDDLWREVLTQQFHDILPGSSIAWVHADAEAVFERVAAELEERIAGLLAEIAPARSGRSPTRPMRRSRAWWCWTRPTTSPTRSPAANVSPTAGWRSVASVPALGVAAFESRSIDDRVVCSDCVDDQLAPRGAVGPRRQPLLDHRSRAGPRGAARRARSAPSWSWRPIIRSSTTRGTSRRGRAPRPCRSPTRTM